MLELTEEVWIDLSKKTLVHLQQSLNQPHVTAGVGQQAEPAISFLMVVVSGTEQMELYTGLFFAESRRRVLYRAGPFLAETLSERMQESEAFTGEMGFLMDNLNFGSADPEKRKDLIRVVPFFYKELKMFFQALKPEEREIFQAKAESLAQRDVKVDQRQAFVSQYMVLVSML